jgi:hypothetical protein
MSVNEKGQSKKNRCSDVTGRVFDRGTIDRLKPIVKLVRFKTISQTSGCLCLITLDFFKSRTPNHGQQGIFVEMEITLSQATHNEKATFGASYDLNVLAGGA